MESKNSSNTTFKCNRCSMEYYEYKQLLEHLYWRHGTESIWCNKCLLKRWHYAVHVCHILPIYDNNDNTNTEDATIEPVRETDFCYCGKFIADSEMIGCDNPSCCLQWYHFECVGISAAPDGEWLCPTCVKSQDHSKVTEENAASILIQAT